MVQRDGIRKAGTAMLAYLIVQEHERSLYEPSSGRRLHHAGRLDGGVFTCVDSSIFLPLNASETL